MKRKDKIFVYVVVGLMFFSAFALSIIVIFGSDESQDAVTGNQTDTVVEEEPEVVEQEEVPDVTTPSIVDGVEWPIVLDAPLSELESEDLVEGTGNEAAAGDVVVVNYRLAQADGTPVAGNDTFASGSPFQGNLVTGPGGLIAGWVEGVPGMKEGGLRRLKVPSNLAYNDGIDLVFDIELVEVNP